MQNNQSLGLKANTMRLEKDSIKIIKSFQLLSHGNNKLYESLFI